MELVFQSVQVKLVSVEAVATNSNVQFANLTLSGNLTVNGTTTTVSSTNTVVSDTLLELGNGTSGSPSNDAGLVIEEEVQTMYSLVGTRVQMQSHLVQVHLLVHLQVI